MQQIGQYIEFKDGGKADPDLAQRLKAEWESGLLHPATALVVLYAGRQHFLLTGHPAIITCLYRPKTNDSGVHAVWRGADLRCTDMSEEQRHNWCWSIKKAFPEYSDYSSSPTAVTALIHEVRGESGHALGLHLHVQSPPREPRPPLPGGKPSIV